MAPTPSSARAEAAAGNGADRLRASGLAGETNFLVARLRSRGSADANARLAPLGLKVRPYSVLALACSGLAPTQRELAAFLSLDPSQIVALVDGLQKRGLVEREPDPADRRSRLVVATPAGRELYDRARAATGDAEEATLGALDAGERRTLLALLAKVAFAG